ncbi:hypothetical protein GWK47_006286 [Chionoecetes opilio]|uniref:Uncharacterized protein n=1 Tax=Chionoecetes opilio TaxID=41210 RepID=A0A8J5CH51_CHIOP|nr:hypothetical protein GWK47_006286 [Chionoecetes opilio]
MRRTHYLGVLRPHLHPHESGAGAHMEEARGDQALTYAKALGARPPAQEGNKGGFNNRFSAMFKDLDLLMGICPAPPIWHDHIQNFCNTKKSHFPAKYRDQWVILFIKYNNGSKLSSSGAGLFSTAGDVLSQRGALPP